VAAGEADAVDATLRILHVSTRHLARDDRRLASLLEQVSSAVLLLFKLEHA